MEHSLPQLPVNKPGVKERFLTFPVVIMLLLMMSQYQIQVDTS